MDMVQAYSLTVTPVTVTRYKAIWLQWHFSKFPMSYGILKLLLILSHQRSRCFRWICIFYYDLSSCCHRWQNLSWNWTDFLLLVVWTRTSEGEICQGLLHCENTKHSWKKFNANFMSNSVTCGSTSLGHKWRLQIHRKQRLLWWPKIRRSFKMPCLI